MQNTKLRLAALAALLVACWSITGCGNDDDDSTPRSPMASASDDNATDESDGSGHGQEQDEDDSDDSQDNSDGGEDNSPDNNPDDETPDNDSNDDSGGVGPVSGVDSDDAVALFRHFTQYLNVGSKP